MFYIVVFAGMAVLLVVAGLTQRARNRHRSYSDGSYPSGAVTRRARRQARAGRRHRR